MGRKHIWYNLKDEEGQPINEANINLYLTGTATEATIYNSVSTSAGLDQPVISDSDGFFEFYLGDQFEDLPNIGYSPTQYFDLVWSSPSGSGIVDGLQLFDLIFPVDETDSTDTEKNKMLSNELAYKFTTHVDDRDYPTLPHDINPVDLTDPTDATLNKVVNNDLLNRMYGFPITSGGLSIETSGALATTHILYASAFTPSGYYVTTTFDNELFRAIKYPIAQIWERDSGNMIIPVDIKDIDVNIMRVILASGSGDMVITTIGEPA